jgi:hypothetical protein
MRNQQLLKTVPAPTPTPTPPPFEKKLRVAVNDGCIIAGYVWMSPAYLFENESLPELHLGAGLVPRSKLSSQLLKSNSAIQRNNHCFDIYAVLRYYPSTVRNTPEERISYQHRGGSVKLHITVLISYEMYKYVSCVGKCIIFYFEPLGFKGLSELLQVAYVILFCFNMLSRHF